MLWWFGDVVGILVVAPLLLVLYDVRHASGRRGPSSSKALPSSPRSARRAPSCSSRGAWRYPYLILPFLLWAALRFRQVGAAVSSFVVGAIGTWAAVDGSLPLGGDTATERVQVAQAAFAVVVVSLLVVGATLAEREAATESLALTAARSERPSRSPTSVAGSGTSAATW